MFHNCLVRTCDVTDNVGTVVNRQPNVCAASKPNTIGSKGGIKSVLQNYCLEDEVNALLHDAIIPPQKPHRGRQRGSPPKDMRNAGMFTEARNLINPPINSKCMDTINELKETSYASYWNKPLGSSRDTTPLLPEGGLKSVTFGKSTKSKESLYDVICPGNSCPNQDLHSHMPGVKSNRNYYKPAFDENKTFGYKYQSSLSIECCLKYENICLGKHLSSPIDVAQAKLKETTTPKLGLSLTPNDAIKSVPKGFRFGQVTKLGETAANCLKHCKINPKKKFIYDCLGHLNCVRKCLRKSHPHTIFSTCYLKLKFMDKRKTGWLPKKEIYDFCTRNRILFQPNFIEPLLSTWNIFDGSNIEYETFIRVINYREPLPELPKIQDIEENYINVRTTYGEMVKPGQEHDVRSRAGLPTVRCLDLDCPVFSQMVPSILAKYDVTYHDMYAARDQKTIRSVFENRGDKFTDEKFERVWNEAAKYHSKGIVCYESFCKALSAF